MKISKLFHWLYAFLMFLPVFFVAGRCFYVIFNKNAYQSYSGQQYLAWEDISSIDDLEIGKRYQFNNQLGTYSDTSTKNTGKVYYSNVEDLMTTSSIFANLAANSNNFTFYYSNVGISIYFSYDNTNVGNANLNNDQLLTFNFILEGYNSTNLSNNFSFLKYRNMNSDNYLDNAFEYSMDSINDTPLFSWAQTSFLSEPMLYITGVFGMPNNSPVITLLSYWLSISIVWLVFDLVMYVPLLVHRWIDRGILE